MKAVKKKGSTSEFIEFVLRDSTTGQRKTGLLYSGVTIKYTRSGASGETSITPVTMTAGTWTSGGFIELSSNGKYQLGIPNAVLASGANEASITITGTGFLDKEISIQLTGVDLQDGVKGGFSALPNAAFGSGAGALPSAMDTSGRVDVLKINGVTITTNGATGLDSIGTDYHNSGAISAFADLSNYSGLVSIDSQYSISGHISSSLNFIQGYDISAGFGIGVVNWTNVAKSFTYFLNTATQSLTVASVNQTGDNFARIGANGANLTALATASAQATMQTSINNINNLSALATLIGPQAAEVPATGTVSYQLTLLVKDSEGHSLDLSANPTVAAANATGTSRTANLSAVTKVSTGVYQFTYSVASTHAQEGITVSAVGTASSDATSRAAYCSFAVVAIDTLAAISAIKAKTDQLTFSAGNVLSSPQTAVTVSVNNDKTGYALTAAYDAAKTAASAASVSTLQGSVNLIPQNPLLTNDARLPAGLVASEANATTNVNTVTGLIGTPAGGTLAAAIAAVKTDTASLVSSLTALALKLSGITSLANWLRAGYRSSTPDATALSEINSSGGTYSAANMSLQKIASIAGTGGGGGGGGGNVTINVTEVRN